jgi:hypothetical protein
MKHSSPVPDLNRHCRDADYLIIPDRNLDPVTVRYRIDIIRKWVRFFDDGLRRDLAELEALTRSLKSKDAIRGKRRVEREKRGSIIWPYCRT